MYITRIYQIILCLTALIVLSLSSSTYAQSESEALYQSGNAYYEQGQYDMAITEYTKAIALNPQYDKAYNRRGAAYVQKKLGDLALADYGKAIALNPQYANAYYNRALVHGVNGKYTWAIADCTKAIALNPQEANFYRIRGTIYALQGNVDFMLVDFTKAIELNPQYADPVKDEISEMIVEYTKEIELYPNSVMNYLNRASLYKYIGEDELADNDVNYACKLQVEIFANTTGGRRSSRPDLPEPLQRFFP